MVHDDNVTTNETSEEISQNVDVMMILSSTIACVGIVSNLTVVIVFLNHKKLRCKIPNMFIINQLSANLKNYSDLRNHS